MPATGERRRGPRNQGVWNSTARHGTGWHALNASLDNDAIVDISDCTGAFNQQWTLANHNNTTGDQLVVRHSGKCLGILIGGSGGNPIAALPGASGLLPVTGTQLSLTVAVGILIAIAGNGLRRAGRRQARR